MLKTLKNIRRRDTDKFMIPHSVQEVIPIRTVWKSGILLVGQNRYSRTWQFSDINYALAGEEDQKSMLLGYSALLNLSTPQPPPTPCRPPSPESSTAVILRNTS